MITAIKKRIFRFKQADLLFKLTRDYNSRWERWVCRYHLYLQENDYSPRQHLTYPTSRVEYIKTIARYLQEMEEVYYGSFFDSREHYDGCRLYLKSMLTFTRHYPLLWLLRFRLRF
jgi:hypothetical protein